MEPTPEIKKLLDLALKRIAQRKLYDYKPYPYQLDFHNAGAQHQERMLMAGNRCGKTFCAAAEVAMHATGIYPPWWKGKRFNEPVLIWAASVTNESSRDIVQKELLGGLSQETLGTGSIPGDKIVGKPTTRQAGISEVADSAKVRHISGGLSNIVFKSYDQGWRKFQGTAPHVVWLDEEPDDFKLYSESLTRLMTSKGIMLVTFTPLLGETALVRHYMNPQAGGIYLKTATWDDVTHLTDDDKKRFEASMPEWERDSRVRGIPMMGEGRVFSIGENDIKVPRFQIPDHFARICGIDFGIEHYGAGAWWAWDRDRDIVYLYDSYRQKGETSVYHAHSVKARGDWIPVAWPHDGLNRGKADGRPLKDMFAEHGVNMLGMSARYKNDSGGAQGVEPIIISALERMKTGRLKVFEDQREWFEEFRSYHRENGRIVDKNDDLLKASFYGLMMLRYAVPKGVIGRADDREQFVAGLR